MQKQLILALGSLELLLLAANSAVAGAGDCAAVYANSNRAITQSSRQLTELGYPFSLYCLKSGEVNNQAAGANNGLLGSVANWMDSVRGKPEGQGMDPPYENLSACNGTRDCSGTDRAGPQIRAAIEMLRSEQRDQRKALRILVHLIGDVHQPLHPAENRDRGGKHVVILNRYCPVSETKSELCKLHSYWDNKLIKDVLCQRTEQGLVDELVQTPGSVRCDLDDWIHESNQLAKDISSTWGGAV